MGNVKSNVDEGVAVKGADKGGNRWTEAVHRKFSNSHPWRWADYDTFNRALKYEISRHYCIYMTLLAHCSSVERVNFSPVKVWSYRYV